MKWVGESLEVSNNNTTMQATYCLLQQLTARNPNQTFLCIRVFLRP